MIYFMISCSVISFLITIDSILITIKNVIIVVYVAVTFNFIRSVNFAFYSNFREKNHS